MGKEVYVICVQEPDLFASTDSQAPDGENSPKGIIAVVFSFLVPMSFEAVLSSISIFFYEGDGVARKLKDKILREINNEIPGTFTLQEASKRNGLEFNEIYDCDLGTSRTYNIVEPSIALLHLLLVRMQLLLAPHYTQDQRQQFFQNPAFFKSLLNSPSLEFMQYTTMKLLVRMALMLPDFSKHVTLFADIANKALDGLYVDGLGRLEELKYPQDLPSQPKTFEQLNQLLSKLEQEIEVLEEKIKQEKISVSEKMRNLITSLKEHINNKNINNKDIKQALSVLEARLEAQKKVDTLTSEMVKAWNEVNLKIKENELSQAKHLRMQAMEVYQKVQTAKKHLYETEQQEYDALRSLYTLFGNAMRNSRDNTALFWAADAVLTDYVEANNNKIDLAKKIEQTQGVQEDLSVLKLNLGKPSSANYNRRVAKKLVEKPFEQPGLVAKNPHVTTPTTPVPNRANAWQGGMYKEYGQNLDLAKLSQRFFPALTNRLINEMFEPEKIIRLLLFLFGEKYIFFKQGSHQLLFDAVNMMPTLCEIESACILEHQRQVINSIFFTEVKLNISYLPAINTVSSTWFLPSNLEFSPYFLIVKIRKKDFSVWSALFPGFLKAGNATILRNENKNENENKNNMYICFEKQDNKQSEGDRKFFFGDDLDFLKAQEAAVWSLLVKFIALYYYACTKGYVGTEKTLYFGFLYCSIEADQNHSKYFAVFEYTLSLLTYWYQNQRLLDFERKKTYFPADENNTKTIHRIAQIWRLALKNLEHRQVMQSASMREMFENFYKKFDSSLRSMNIPSFHAYFHHPGFREKDFLNPFESIPTNLEQFKVIQKAQEKELITFLSKVNYET